MSVNETICNWSLSPMASVSASNAAVTFTTVAASAGDSSHCGSRVTQSGRVVWRHVEMEWMLNWIESNQVSCKFHLERWFVWDRLWEINFKEIIKLPKVFAISVCFSFPRCVVLLPASAGWPGNSFQGTLESTEQTCTDQPNLTLLLCGRGTGTKSGSEPRKKANQSLPATH